MRTTCEQGAVAAYVAPLREIKWVVYAKRVRAGATPPVRRARVRARLVPSGVRWLGRASRSARMYDALPHAVGFALAPVIP